MGKQDEWQARICGLQGAGHRPGVVQNGSPAVGIGEMSEADGRRGVPSMAAMVMRPYRVARSVERCGEASIAAAVLGHAMHDVDEGTGVRDLVPAVDRR